MLPVADQNPTRTTPYVNYALIALNIVAFLYEWTQILAHGDSYVVSGYGLVPTRIWADPLGEGFTIFSSMFMHGGWGHLGGNMLFLWIFGDNIEDAVGHLRYIAFYLCCGVCAAVAQVLTNTSSPAAMVGASGAIAGVLGAYLVLYPRAPVTVFVFIFFISLPAWVVIGEWFLLNLTGGVQSLGLGSSGGVAFFAHIGGFLAGVLGVRIAMSGRTRAQASVFTGFRNVPRSRFGLPPSTRGSGLPGPGPGRWDSWR
ncbi:MAG TPA: rhomboid family intramembrane serine protease [Polyangiaceae bacterium]|jgi:membrane associated rhomboid family serine protease